jgi:hypothetical protein
MIDLFQDSTRKQIAAYIRNEIPRIEYQAEIFEIMEGNVKGLLEEKMLEDLGRKSFSAARTRQAPINVFRKIVDKLTKIYDGNVTREVVGGNEQDEKLVQWYEEILSVNRKFSKNNENFNAYLYGLLQIGLNNPKPGELTRKPFIRSIPNHQFLVMNTSMTDPTTPDVIIVFMGKRQDAKGERQDIFYVYTDYQFIIIDQSGDIIGDMMSQRELDGENIYGVTPFAYANGSQDCVMPSIQPDNKDMTLLIPLLLTDLNYAVKFQAFSVFVGIDIDDKQVEFSPNSILLFQTKPGGEKPSFDVVKPTIDIGETLSLASSQMSLWLSSKGIRPGQIGQIGADQLSSGISKMIEESDTFDSIKKQITIYEEFEREFWEKLLKDIHPKWVAAGIVENKTIFTPSARVVTKFVKPTPMQTRGELVKDLEAEVVAGFTSKKRAVSMLNTGLSEDELEDLMDEIEEEKFIIKSGVQGNGTGEEQGDPADSADTEGL